MRSISALLTRPHSPIDIALHEWAEGRRAKFWAEGNLHPQWETGTSLAPEIAALLEKWTHSDLVDVREVRLLGEGGMAQVFLGTQQVPPRHVAVKRLRGNTLELAEQLFSEALLTGSLEHPNIIPVHSIKIDPERGPEVVLKRVEGESLEQAFLRIGQTEAGLKELLAKLLQVCNALEYAHSKGVLHRDIKPENIMLGQYGEVYLLDWGIAIDTQSQEKPNEGLWGRLTILHRRCSVGTRRSSMRAPMFIFSAQPCIFYWWVSQGMTPQPRLQRRFWRVSRKSSNTHLKCLKVWGNRK